MMKRLSPLVIIIVLILFLAQHSVRLASWPYLSAGSLMALGTTTGVDKTINTGFDQDVPDDLPTVGSYENLKALLEEINATRSKIFHGSLVRAGIALEVQGAASVKAAPQTNKDYSTTNTQVQGVDEADIAKTDGKYIYQVNNRRVIVIKAYPPEDMKIVSVLKFEEEKFVPRELYVDDKYLVVLGSTYHSIVPIEPKGPVPEIWPPPPVRNTVEAVIYDISSKTNIKKLREVELEGDYVSSREIGSSLYLIANKYLDYYRIMKGETEGLTPSYRDSAFKDEFVSVDYPDIRYFPGFIEPNYLIVAALDLDRPDDRMDVSTYLGAGENVYASQENLYIAVTRYQVPEKEPDRDAAAAPKRVIVLSPVQSDTAIYKFALQRGRVLYRDSGKVPGRVLNQFSMDEYKGYFRIATTRGEIWRDDQYTSRNNIYVLDKTLKAVGKVEDIAPGEKIYAARFIGDRGYLVTFKKVDPFFVIDLKNPRNPKILGALKIPGYSDYLHPYDENHIIGFGKDTIEIAQKDRWGNETGSMAFYQGMKIAIFDVSDVRNPVEEFKEVIGDRGTGSELLRNHKALLFNKEKNLLAFPVTVMEIKHKKPAGITNMPQYGEFTFQGAYVYHVDLDSGFTLKGKITHLTSEDYLKSGRGWYNSGRNVERIIYIGDTLYTLSKEMVKAHDLTSLREINSLRIGDPVVIR
ncbi:MAG: beta-propeller domain-containing protein [Peptococcaceae bacterium]|nr:beta-propeller domain-containing protein [Peptococcaceae bacterium]